MTTVTMIFRNLSIKKRSKVLYGLIQSKQSSVSLGQFIYWRLCSCKTQLHGLKNDEKITCTVKGKDLHVTFFLYIAIALFMKQNHNCL